MGNDFPGDFILMKLLWSHFCGISRDQIKFSLMNISVLLQNIYWIVFYVPEFPGRPRKKSRFFLQIHVKFWIFSETPCTNLTTLVLLGIIYSKAALTHWGRVICVTYLIVIASDNGLSPSRHQAIIRTNAGILLIRPLGTDFSEILIKVHTFSFTKMHVDC